MSIESDEGNSVNLKEYVDVNFDLRDRALKLKHEANELALALATAQLEARLEKLNRLRENVLPRIEFESFVKETNRRIAALENWQARLVGIGIVLVLISGFIGAAVMRLF